MSAASTTYSFGSLAEASQSLLDTLISTSDAPDLADLSAHEYRGWNIPSLAGVLGIRKFIKGFDKGPAEGRLPGYNSPVLQDGFDSPWTKKLDSNGQPIRYYPYVAVAGVVLGSDAEYPKATVVDYRKASGYFPLNPARFTVDYLVAPNGSANLLLGKSYLQPGVHVQLGFFVLEVFP
jgi:hypothetical protein